jgi:hypothetical protein
LELNDLLMKTADVTAVYNGFTFKLEVWTEKMTPSYKVRLIQLLMDSAEAEAEQTGDSDGQPEKNRAPQIKDEHAVMLADLIKSWDVVLNGEPFAPSYDNLIKLSFQCLAVLTREISTFLGALVNPTTANG